MFKSLIKIDFSSEIIFAFFLFCTYIYWSVMCRFSRRVQDFYCSVQNVQDKQAVVQRCFEPKFCTQRASCTLRKKRHMTDQQIYFSGWTGFVHTCLGLICQFRILFRFALLPKEQCTKRATWKFCNSSMIFLISYFSHLFYLNLLKVT